MLRDNSQTAIHRTKQAIRYGWLFFVLLIWMAFPGCQPRTVPPALQQDEAQVEELRKQIDEGDWE